MKIEEVQMQSVDVKALQAGFNSNLLQKQMYGKAVTRRSTDFGQSPSHGAVGGRFLLLLGELKWTSPGSWLFRMAVGRLVALLQMPVRAAARLTSCWLLCCYFAAWYSHFVWKYSSPSTVKKKESIQTICTKKPNTLLGCVKALWGVTSLR